MNFLFILCIPVLHATKGLLDISFSNAKKAQAKPAGLSQSAFSSPP
jgi:hypothetical protein